MTTKVYHRRMTATASNQQPVRPPDSQAPFFRQDEKLVRFVLTKPPDRVSYRMLNPSDAEMQRIADMAVRAGLLERRLDVRDALDRSFIPADIRPAEIDASGRILP
jgi:hypothetical protein